MGVLKQSVEKKGEVTMGLANRASLLATLLRDKMTGGRTPLVVVLNTTLRCNMRCGYCYGQFYRPSSQDDFSTADLLKLVDDLAKMGTRSITLGGGEPLLRKDIGTIVERIKINQMECGFNTNGTLIPNKIQDLKKADMICVSIDGPQEMNDANRGPGTFEKIMAGIDAALAAGIKVHTTTVLTRNNCDAVDWVVDMARKKGIQAEFNLLFHQAGDKEDSDRYMADNALLRRAAERIVQLKSQGAPILFSKYVYRYVANWPDYRQRLVLGKAPDFPQITCYAGRFLMFINGDGKVYPCVQLIDDFAALDFRQVGIQKAWEHCARHPCRACYFPCFNEFNSIMGLNPAVIGEQVLSTLQRH